MDSKKVGFIGGGNMAFAIAKGLVESGLIKPNNIMASAKTDTRLKTVWKELGTTTSTNNCDVATFGDIIFLCVKPHILPGVMDQIHEGKCLSSDKIYVSVAAGVTLDFMEEKLPNCRVIRTMPNTPCLVMCGVVIYACGKHCLKEDGNTLKDLLKGSGLVEEVQENQIDAMSSLMGCSVAWYQMVIDAMADGGVKNGVPRALAYKLIGKSMEGSAKMLLETGLVPGVLKDQVTSPGGSTICGLYELEVGGVRGIFMKAVDAATNRNRELGKLK